MTSTAVAPAEQVPEGYISCTIDGVAMVVPKGTLIIRAAEQIGIEVPRFCDHPLLSPVAACRMCLVEIVGQPKPQPACAVALADGMEVKTQVTSEMADTAQRGVMEFLLINHPLDCPICDKGGECPLQNQAMSAGRPESRFDGTKRTFPKPINVSDQVLLDRERCVSCARCTRFADEIAGDAFIELQERGAKQQVGIAADTPFDSYFSGNTVQICPVGALTSAGYRFRARPFDLVSTPTGCEHCAAGCAQRTDHRRDLVMRRLAGDDPAVNEEWNCDKGRFAFAHFSRGRIRTPMVRDANGVLQDASWPEAIAAAAAGLAAAGSSVGVLAGGRLTSEDAYAYAKFARAVLGTDDIDFRSRPGSAEEVAFLASRVAGTGVGAATYESLESAPVVLLVGLEPEEESPIIFLRLRKGVLAGTTKVAAITTWASPAFRKTRATLLPAVPGAEADVLRGLAAAADGDAGDVARLLAEPGAVILVGERLATSPGGLSAAAALADQTGAALAWVPRRAGERGALEAGALAGLLPGGRLVTDAGARAEVAAAWGLDTAALPSEPGRTGEEFIADPPAALLIAGVDPDDTAYPQAFSEALGGDTFVVSLEQRLSQVTDAADVVLPVAADVERTGSYVNWEGRSRVFGRVNPDAFDQTDAQVLADLAAAISPEAVAAMGDCRTAELAAELLALGRMDEQRPEMAVTEPGPRANPGEGQAVLATWHHLLDAGVLQAGDPYLAATARAPRVRMSAETAGAIGAQDGQLVRVTGPLGELAFELEITEMPDQVVWVPTNSFPQGETFPAPNVIGKATSIHRVIGAGAGAIVGISPVTSSTPSRQGAS